MRFMIQIQINIQYPELPPYCCFLNSFFMIQRVDTKVGGVQSIFNIVLLINTET